MSTAILEAPKRIRNSNSCYELIDGKIVEKEMGYRERFLALNIRDFLHDFVKLRNLGRAFVEIAFLLPPKKNERIPDAAFISYERWPKNAELGDGNALPAVPELAIEVISPTNSANEVNAKIHEYFGAGVNEVWIVWPNESEIVIYESLDSLRTVRGNATLKTRILPGFELPLAELFPGATPHP